jgi:hypothetical protein
MRYHPAIVAQAAATIGGSAILMAATQYPYRDQRDHYWERGQQN